MKFNIKKSANYLQYLYQRTKEQLELYSHCIKLYVDNLEIKYNVLLVEFWYSLKCKISKVT